MSTPAPAREPGAVAVLDRNQLAVDVLLAGGAFVMLGLATIALGVGTSSSFWDVLAGVGMPVAMVFRRRSPVWSAAAVDAFALLHFAFGSPLLPVDVLIFASVYSVTVHGPLWARRTALGAALLGSLLVPLRYLDSPISDPVGWSLFILLAFAGLASLVVASWALGLLRRSRMQRVESLRERAERLELERDQQAQIATAAERARIAREMHDVVAHSLSVVIAQADGGRYAAANDPAAATRALTTISETGRAALADMRRILGVLRSGPGGDAAVAPQPADADLDELIGHVRASGVDVSLVRVGQPRPLPPGAGLTVYRICQEALTNVLKHAGPGVRVTVLQTWTATHLVLQIDDDGRGAAASSDGAGQGLLGMRERATMFGGTLTAGPRPGGGYRVRAELPLPSRSVPPTPYRPFEPTHAPTHPARPVAPPGSPPQERQ
ncbi:sensor histidine kinase [Beutenbergia cavernae]|uniref:sensor histidine kinase n=1 Tax=Beutenbergia cavernae TaxID=84757 RepID=UPI001FE0D322|nr:sensor histidine kinase [Beutenbergia cavernae]